MILQKIFEICEIYELKITWKKWLKIEKVLSNQFTKVWEFIEDTIVEWFYEGFLKFIGKLVGLKMWVNGLVNHLKLSNQGIVVRLYYLDANNLSGTNWHIGRKLPKDCYSLDYDGCRIGKYQQTNVGGSGKWSDKDNRDEGPY